MSVIHRAVVASAVGVAAAATAAFVLAPAAGAQARSSGSSFIGHFHHLKTIASTVPGNGDVNPYGTVVIPQTQGDLHRGSVLISNFNNKKNLQGTGRTIVQITPGGKLSVFAKIRPNHLPGPCPGGIGLTTALTVLPGGWVVVGSLPTANGMAATAKAGCLLVLDNTGHVRETISGNGINGPWDMTSASFGNMADLFVTNVLNGTVAANGKVVHRGTVLRLNLALYGSQPPAVKSITTIGSGFPQRTDPAALVIGPTGVGLNSQGTLFVANSLVSKINAIPFAVTRAQQRRHRHGGQLRRQAERPARPHRGPERERADRQRRGRPDRGDHAGRHAGRLPVPRQVRQPARRGCAVRPGPDPEGERRVLRGRRGQHAAPAALS